MTKRRLLKRKETLCAQRLSVRLAFVVCLLLLAASAAVAIPVSDYHHHIRQAITALDSVARSDNTESATAYGVRDNETVAEVRRLLPLNEVVEVNGTSINVDNSWLHHDLSSYAAEQSISRYESLERIKERLSALDERLAELEKPAGVAANKAEDNRKLAEILRGAEYARKVKTESGINRLITRLLKWIASWLPKAAPSAPGGAWVIAMLARWFVIILTLAVLVFALKLLLPRILRGGRQKRKSKAKARIVLGERLEADQSALDLLAEAEALALRGELRAAIRRAYIALLVELGDRKVISLAQHKTNRDYLRAMREVEPLYGNVKQLTDSFERHWYGLAQANETDWLAFRSAYKQALR